LFTLTAVVLPWILFGVCFAFGGIPLRGSIIQKYPQESAFIVTSIAAVIYLAIIYLFQNAVTILVESTSTRNINELFFIALRNRAFSPGLWKTNKLGHLLVVMFVGFTFAFVTSGITALLLPINYSRSTTLTGTELDFASNNTDCVTWFANNGISFECGWQVSFDIAFALQPPLNRCRFQSFKDMRYNDCLNDNRMLDAMQAGHSNVCDSKPRPVIYELKTATGSVHARKPHQQHHICI